MATVALNIRDTPPLAAHVRAIRARLWAPQRPAPPVPARTPSTASLPPVPHGRILVRTVLKVTAVYFGTNVQALISDGRKQPLAHQRQIAMYVAHKVTGRGFPFIARFMGKRDHTTILHGVRAVKALIAARDGETIDAVNRIVEHLKGAQHDD